MRLDPAGPFKTVRRIITWLFIGWFALLAVAVAVDAGLLVFLASIWVVPTLGLVWLGCWTVDTVISWRGTSPSDGTPPSA